MMNQYLQVKQLENVFKAKFLSLLTRLKYTAMADAPVGGLFPDWIIYCFSKVDPDKKVVISLAETYGGALRQVCSITEKELEMYIKKGRWS